MRRVMFIAEDPARAQEWLQQQADGLVEEFVVVDPRNAAEVSRMHGGRLRFSVDGGLELLGQPGLGERWELIALPGWGDALDRAAWTDARAWAQVEFGRDI